MNKTKVIDYKKVDMTDQEFLYYKELVKQFSTDTFNAEEFFRDLFDTDDYGFIVMIMPKKSIPMVILHFVQMLMINQRLRIIDELREKI